MTEMHPVPLWLRWWAWLTVLTALPLVILGAEVTTKKVGMADPVGLRNPFYLFEREADAADQPIRAVHLWQTGQYGLLIEHSHRLIGWIVGFECIVFALGTGLLARGHYRWLGLLAGCAVAAQGALGIGRVYFNVERGPALAALHGCMAQLVFAALVAIAVIASRSWHRPTNAIPPSLRWAALGIAVLVYVQVVFGAVLRHLIDPVAQRLHVLLAFAVVLALLWLMSRGREHDPSNLTFWITIGLTVMVCVQPVLGVESWIRRFGSLTLPDELPSTLMGDFVRSGHHVLGTLIFAGTVALTTMLFRPRTETSSSAALHLRAMEGVV
jgi:cytochrome c oxidase assembly protein subunit 15